MRGALSLRGEAPEDRKGAELPGHATPGGFGAGVRLRRGPDKAWEGGTVTDVSRYMRAAAGVILKRSASSPEAQELADSLFGDLYGLSAEKRGSLFRYFHGRSSLKTWLRAVLAQRYVDKIRAGRKFEELGDEDGNDGVSRRVNSAAGLRVDTGADPHRARYLTMFTAALETALKNLDGQGRRAVADVLRGREKAGGDWKSAGRA